MIPIVVLASLLIPLARAVPCVQFDTNWDLYAFGGSQDVKLGQSSSWAQPSATPLSTSGRPPWTGNNTQCLFSQYNNAMYVLDGDSSDQSKVYIYSFAGDSWTTQSTGSAPPNLGNSRSASILDHDTNVIFTLPSGDGANLYQLDMSSVTTSASDSPLSWEGVTVPAWSSADYVPVAAQASNHINYFGVPNTAAGSADIFIVHFALFQNESQTYPTTGSGSAFPDSAGQAISIPNSGDAPPYQMVFVPNDFSSSYVVTHWTDPSDFTKTDTAPMSLDLVNSTQTLSAPTSKDQGAAYAASPSDLVQINSQGEIYYMTNAVGSDYKVSTNANWQKMSYTLEGVSGGSTSPSGSSSAAPSGTASAGASGASAGASGSVTSAGGAAASGASSAAAAPSGAAGMRVEGVRFDLMAVALGAVALGAAVVL